MSGPSGLSQPFVLHRMRWAHQPSAEVGYWCRSSRPGQGVISEAVAALVRHGFEHLHLARLDIVTEQANGAACRVAEPCGFVLDAVLTRQRRSATG